MKDPTILPVSQVVARLHEFNTIIDARSPGEFAEDHLPGAINAPVLDDEERAIVGTANARDGAFEAKRLGAALVCRNIGDLVEQRFGDRNRDWSPLVYCWRGGQRSGSLATVMARIGWRTSVIEGGYRAFRRQVIADLAALAPSVRLVVIGGRTGSAKSRLLETLAAQGEQVLDLEHLAQHRGSVLGALPGSCQPSQKRFETLLWDALRGFAPDRPVFVESESRKIGQCQVPEPLIEAIRGSEVAIIEADVSVRGRFLLDEYRHFRGDEALLLSLLEKLVPLHGGQRVGEWQSMVTQDRWPELVERLLVEHYDPSYDRSMKRNFSRLASAPVVPLSGTAKADLALAAEALRDRYRA